MPRFLISLFLILTLAQNSFASDCLPSIDSVMPLVNIPSVGIEMDPNTTFCFDEKIEKNEEALKIYTELKSKNVFTENGCVKDEKFEVGISQKITDLMITTIRSHLNFYTLDTSLTSPEKSPVLIVTNSEKKEFVDKALKESLKNDNRLDAKDKLEIATAVVTSSLIGTMIERRTDAFRNKDGSLQHDKLLHTNFGTLINIGSVGASYLILESAGLGDKLGLSKKQKKWAILLTGSVIGMVVGYGKERFYDYNHRDIHTYDPHLKGDMGATWLGGGSLNIITGSFAF